MSWKRLGFVYQPKGDREWSRTHAAQPTPVFLRDETFRIFFSSRDADQRSHVGWVDVELSTDTPRVVGEAQDPTFKPGAVGTFDDSGVSIGSAVDTGQEIRIYYMGWNLGVGAPWRNSIGFMRANSVDGPFQRYSEGPVMDRSPEDPYTMSYPLVLQLGPGLWRMWYGSSLTWGESLDGKSHVIKQASSSDGIRWERDGRIAVGLSGEDEQFLVRPTVLPFSGGYLMMFASRGQQYTLGAALSRDGENWERCDARFGLKAGTDAWEDAAVCYPALFSHRGRIWLAYNGNGYGRTGFGLAMWTGSTTL